MSNTVFEESGLVGVIANNLSICRTKDDLARLALEQIETFILAEALFVQWIPTVEQATADVTRPRRSRLISRGDFPIANDEFRRIVEQLNLDESDREFVDNELSSSGRLPSNPQIREIVVVPIARDQAHYGWLGAINRSEGNHAAGGFGDRETELLASVGVLLAVHASNRDLYREQSELAADVVRALVSAIDAKDPYTSGHSDRVARFAVRIALEMRFDPKFVKFIYLAGLLHDVGKIGISDSVLSKVGRLTPAEFEHIKLHPQLGCKILADLRQLAEVLPAVRHHHEQWDGLGYPDRLVAEHIPMMARIMAVADAYDAMSTDRPYRKGLAEEKVDGILRDGSGKQWDPEVLEAFFAAKNDILAIAENNRPDQETIEEQFV